MRRNILYHLQRHWDILLTLFAAIFSAGVLYSSNNSAIADLDQRTNKLEKKVDAALAVKEDVAAIKQKVDDIWYIMNSRHENK